jgi:ribonuclease HI
MLRHFYTDGSVGANNQKAGGWAFIEVENGKIKFEKYKADFSKDLTSDKMELRAVIEALKSISVGECARIYSDSQYVIKGVNEWVAGWQKNNWLNSKKELRPLQEMWKELLSEKQGKIIDWVWVRAHASDNFNNYVDRLAKQCYSRLEDPKINFYENNFKPKVGSLIYFEDTSKKYIVLMTDIFVDGEEGFLTKMLANSFGNELSFFRYKENKFNEVLKQTRKEANLSFKTVEMFIDKASFEFLEMKKIMLKKQ